MAHCPSCATAEGTARFTVTLRFPNGNYRSDHDQTAEQVRETLTSLDVNLLAVAVGEVVTLERTA